MPKYNTGSEYYFMDVFELLILIMIIRREVINFGIKTKHYELLGASKKQEEGAIVDEYSEAALQPLLGQKRKSRVADMRIDLKAVEESRKGKDKGDGDERGKASNGKNIRESQNSLQKSMVLR